MYDYILIILFLRKYKIYEQHIGYSIYEYIGDYYFTNDIERILYDCCINGYSNILSIVNSNDLIRYRLNAKYCSITCKNNNLNVLQILIHNKFKTNYNTIINAARTGNIQIIEYLYHNDCKFNESALYAAVVYNRFSVLKWLFMHGFKLNKYMCKLSCVHGNINMLEYLINNNCEYDKHECIYAAIKYKHNHILQYMLEL
jgi:hypothetical protein